MENGNIGKSRNSIGIQNSTRMVRKASAAAPLTPTAVRRLTVPELRKRLGEMGEDSKGLKADLVERFIQAQKEGDTNEEKGSADAQSAPEKPVEKPEKQGKEEKEETQQPKLGPLEWETPEQIEARLSAIRARRDGRSGSGQAYVRLPSGAEVSAKKQKESKKRSLEDSSSEPSQTLSQSQATGGSAAHRSWKNARAPKRARTVKGGDVTTVGKSAKAGKGRNSWRKKEEIRRETAAVRQFSREQREEREMEKEKEAQRLRDRRKRREENARKSQVAQIITNPETIRRMTRKQLRSVQKV
jgi:Cgr1 family/SAP domain